MKVLKPGRPQKGWSTKSKCTGAGNGNGGCGAELLVEEDDLFQTSSSHYDGSTDYYVTFKCPSCGVLTDIKNYTGNKRLPKRTPSQVRVPTLNADDFAFSVEAGGSRWDVYYFIKDQKEGTLAFREKDGQFEIGVFKAGKLNSDEVLEALTEAVH